MQEKYKKYQKPLEKYLFEMKGTFTLSRSAQSIHSTPYMASAIGAAVASSIPHNLLGGTHLKAKTSTFDVFEKSSGHSDNTVKESSLDSSNTILDKQIENYINNKGESFNHCLFRMIDTRGLKDSDVYNRACISRQLFSKIRCKQEYIPTKPIILSLAIGMHLTINETEELLACGKQILSRSDTGDLIIRFFIEQGEYDIDLYNDYLYEYHQHLLGSGASA